MLQDYKDPIRTVLVINQETDTVPPFALLEIRSFDQETGAFLVGKPSRSGRNDLLVNGPQPIDPGGEGQAKDQPEVADALTGQAATCTEIIKRLADAMEAANAAAKQGAKA
jgi:hypothetical protein